MLPEKYQWIDVHFEPEGNPRYLFDIARELEEEGNLQGAATVYDRAYGLDPSAEDIREARTRVLDQLAVVEHGLCFRYIPGGVFLMGCDFGEEDERPWHPVWLSPYWMSETPVSWATYCQLMDWEPPPASHPREAETLNVGEQAMFHLYEANKIRLQYCEDHTMQAGDWHRHSPGQQWQSGGQPVSAQELFGAPPRDQNDAPWQYGTKPMVGVAWQEVLDLTKRLSTDKVCYSIPTEAQWEKAARGGLIGARYAWGNNLPNHQICDYGHFNEFLIRPMRIFPPNGYGLYAVSGGVWEWTSDWYDRDYYQNSPEVDPTGPTEGEQKVLRGGSWADCPEAVTVTFRMSRGSSSWVEGKWGSNLAPNIGFRLCRKVVG